MGMLIKGKWQSGDVRDTDTDSASKSDGSFKRKEVTFRNSIAKDGDHPPATGRYHLFVSHACPWAHRTLIMRTLKGLEDAITVDVVSPDMLENGWSFAPEFDPEVRDSLFGSKFLHEIYTKADSKYTGKVTVPILWDKAKETIVNNESSEIIRFFNSAFEGIATNSQDFYPEELREEIDGWNDLIYPAINNGVYKCGFARSQQAYEQAFGELFEALSKVEKSLSKTMYLVDSTLTEADIRLFTTLVRFDPVYHTHFKCNGKLIVQHPNLFRYMRNILALPGVEETIHLDHIKRHYYYSHESINPSRIVAKGPI